jgi:hypothetical protein
MMRTMARMITGIQAWKGHNKSEITRLASREASVWLRGWKGGVTDAFYEQGNIRFQVFRDLGSTSPESRSLIAEFIVPE